MAPSEWEMKWSVVSRVGNSARHSSRRSVDAASRTGIGSSGVERGRWGEREPRRGRRVARHLDERELLAGDERGTAKRLQRRRPFLAEEHERRRGPRVSGEQGPG